MIIKIEATTEASPEEVFAYFREKCRESLQKFSIEIEGTELKFTTK